METISIFFPIRHPALIELLFFASLSLKSDIDYKVFRKNGFLCASERLFQKWEQGQYPKVILIHERIIKNYGYFKN